MFRCVRRGEGEVREGEGGGVGGWGASLYHRHAVNGQTVL